MKIIIPNLSIPILHNISQCLESIKERASLQPLLWSVNQKPLLDVFDEVSPDLLFLHNSQIDGSFAIACQEFDFQYILVGDVGAPSLPKLPIAVLTSPDLVNEFPSDWNPIPIKFAAAIAQVHNGSYKKTMASDILVHTTNAEQLTPEVINMLCFLSERYHTKIIGDAEVKLHHYLGKVDMFERANFIKSSKILLALNGQEAWDASYLKVPPLCVSAVAPHFIQCKDVNSLQLNIDILLKDKSQRTKYTNTCYREVGNGNTYYHIAKQLFESINHKDVAQHLDNYIQELII